MAGGNGVAVGGGTGVGGTGVGAGVGVNEARPANTSGKNTRVAGITGNGAEPGSGVGVGSGDTGVGSGDIGVACGENNVIAPHVGVGDSAGGGVGRDGVGRMQPKIASPTSKRAARSPERVRVSMS
jgi:hypothetical protein